VTCITTVIYTSMLSIQHKIRMLEGSMCLRACSVSSFHVEVVGLMVVTWKILKRQLLPMHTALTVL
jgi:hypothetical protein